MVVCGVTLSGSLPLLARLRSSNPSNGYAFMMQFVDAGLPRLGSCRWMQSLGILFSLFEPTFSRAAFLNGNAVAFFRLTAACGFVLLVMGFYYNWRLHNYRRDFPAALQQITEDRPPGQFVVTILEDAVAEARRLRWYEETETASSVLQFVSLRIRQDMALDLVTARRHANVGRSTIQLGSALLGALVKWLHRDAG
jgi:hypothetical protein